MFCHQCGSVVSQDVASCGACGAPVRAARGRILRKLRLGTRGDERQEDSADG